MPLPEHELSLKAVPLFPLPNVVLFPRAVLPLHIFEERYKRMTADALEGEGQVGMALLKKGWEKHYYGRAAIYPVVCVGRIVSHERLPDGRYNFLLEGLVRATIVRELEHQPYRVAELRRMEERPAMEIDMERERARLEELLGSEAAAGVPAVRAFRQLLRSPWPTADIADLLAFTVFEDTDLKQRLLSEPEVRARVGAVVGLMEQVVEQIGRRAEGFGKLEMN